MCECLIIQKHSGRIVDRTSSVLDAHEIMQQMHEKMRSLYEILPIPNGIPDNTVYVELRACGHTYAFADVFPIDKEKLKQRVNSHTDNVINDIYQKHIR